MCSSIALSRLVLAAALAAVGCAPAPSAEQPATTEPTPLPTVAPLRAVAVTGLERAEAEELARLALADPWTQQAVRGTRSEAVEVYNPADGKSGVLVWIYDYTNLRALLVEVDSGSRTIIGRKVTDAFPNFSPAEHADAAEIAVHDPKVLARTGGQRYVVIAQTGAANIRCRCIAVTLTPAPAVVTPRIMPIVDLSTRSVVGFVK